MGKGHTPWSGHRGNRDRQELEGWRIFHTPPDRTVCHLLADPPELRVSRRSDEGAGLDDWAGVR
jgi:hypothetical protein